MKIAHHTRNASKKLFSNPTRPLKTCTNNEKLFYMVEDDDELVNQAEDTMTILSKYIDGLTINVDSAKLKNLMRELYVESLNTEIIE